MAAIRDITILQGATFTLPLYWYDGDPVVKAITAVTKAYPPVVTATAHGMPANKIPVQIKSVGGMEDLNTPGDDTVYALKLTADTFSLPDIDAAEFDAYTSGGYVVYRAPKNLTGYTARMQIRKSVTAADTLLELTDGNGRLVLGGTEGSITILLSAVDTAALNFTTAVYQLELDDGSGVVTRLVGGGVTLDKEVTR